MSLDREPPNYFGAGPAVLPTTVLQQAAVDLLNYADQGIGIGEISHRSKPAIQVIDDTKAALKQLMAIPDNYEVFFMQGGGTTGFSSIAYNLAGHYATEHGAKGRAAYAVTGLWLKKLAEEAARLGLDVDVVVNTKEDKFATIPPYSQWKPLAKDTAYLYVCDNETVNGTEFPDVPPADYLPEGCVLVADTSSNILLKKVDVSKYGVIMAGAQKNIGLAGLTIYIVRKDLLTYDDAKVKAAGLPLVPIAFKWDTVVANNSAYNTIPIFTCHILKLVTEKLIAEGGVEAVEARNQQKAQSLYLALEAYPNFYKLPVADPKVRLKMNVVFTLPLAELEAKFLKEAGDHGLTGLKGHRSVGGMRASLYNAVTLDSVNKLVAFVTKFAEENQ